MNAIEQVKYLLENFSQARSFIIHSEKDELNSDPKIDLLEVNILFSALPIIYQVLVRILLEKISHIDITQFKPVSKNEVFPESEFKKMLKTHNYNYIFCYFLERLSTLRIRDTRPYADAFTGRPLPPLLTLNDYCYSEILEGRFSPQIQAHFRYASHVQVKNQVLSWNIQRILIEKCETKLPLCLPSNDLEYKTT